jgi:tetratricopeptide (TPR) repeat protein
VQANAVNLCFELDQPQMALRYIEKIGDWRRGEGYADYAFYRAQHGITNDAQLYLNLAEEISSVTDQDWGRDRIRTAISRTHTQLGQSGLADKYKIGVDQSESGKVARVEATLCTETTLDAQIQALDALIAPGDFDPVKNALYAYAELFGRFYENTERRTQIEEKIKTSWKPLPFFIRIDLLIEMSGFALQHADQVKARELVDEAKAIMDSLAWPAEYYIPLASRLAVCRFQSGDEAAACSMATGLLTFYNEHQSEILNTDRSKTLCSVAEAFKEMGDTSSALAAYKQAVDVGTENRNSRPRAEDLSAICLSMVKHRMEPDTALWARIREIKGALGDPW